MFDSKAMVEHSEEQPASEAAMMASIMVGRASSSGSSSSGGGNPPKTVSQVCRRKNDRWYCAKELKIARLALVLAMLASVPFGWAHISSCVAILSIGSMPSTMLPCHRISRIVSSHSPLSFENKKNDELN